jgi:hypothetical protein
VGLNHWGCQPAFQLSAIDTMSFIEYGDVQRNFSKWLDTFVDLAPLAARKNGPDDDCHGGQNHRALGQKGRLH